MYIFDYLKISVKKENILYNILTFCKKLYNF